MKPLTDSQRSRVRRLRRTETDAERKLWSRLRDRQIAGAKFRRQQAIGPFVADFCCLEIGLVVEVDGGQHANAVRADGERTQVLEREGFRVVRFWNNEVLGKTDAVVERIANVIEECRAEGRCYGMRRR